MADKRINELPAMEEVTPETLIPAEQDGVAKHLTGEQFADFAREASAAHAQRAVDAADAAETAKSKAQQAATTAGGYSADAENSAAEARQSAADALQSALDAAASRQAIEDMGVEAETLSPGSVATVSKTVAPDGTVTLHYGIPTGAKGDQGETGPAGGQGVKGDKGDKGDRGDSGVTSPIAGFYTIYVDEDGNLWAVYPSADATPAFEYDSDTGNLYCVIGGQTNGG